MNPKVEEFIKHQKQKQNESRAKHLKSLGLIEYAETGEKNIVLHHIPMRMQKITDMYIVMKKVVLSM